MLLLGALRGDVVPLSQRGGGGHERRPEHPRKR